MSYRNTLIERSRQFDTLHEEPAVLDYLQLRNRQCLNAWRMKRAEHALALARSSSQPGMTPSRNVA